MANAGSVGRLRAIAELLFLRGRAAMFRGALALVIAVACCGLGAASLDVQSHFAAQPPSGRLTTFLAQGSTAATAWTGWAAACFFAVALLRMRRGAPEPPVGRGSVESLTITQMRAGLVREYTVVRVALCVLGAVALTDLARATRYVVAAVTGDSLARASLAATVIEAAGLVVATAVLALWSGTFRRQLVRFGALPG